MFYGGVTAPVTILSVNSTVVEYLYWFVMSWVHGVCWWGHSKIHKNDTSKALQCTRHIVLLGYATIKLVKLKIINDTVTSITGRRGKLQRILSDAFKCTEVGLSYVCNNISTPMATQLCIKLRWDLLLAARFLHVQQRLTMTQGNKKTNKNQMIWATPRSTKFNPPNTKYHPMTNEQWDVCVVWRCSLATSRQCDRLLGDVPIAIGC